MNARIRQMILGFGTFGTGTTLLILHVNPVLTILTDTVVGVGMLFAAGSVTMEDLHLKKLKGPGESPAATTEGIPGEVGEIPTGLLASLGKLKVAGKSSSAGKGNEDKGDRVKEIDRMLDQTLAGQSKRLISLAEGQGSAAAPAAPAAAAAGQEEDLLQQFSKAQIGKPFGEEEGTDEGAAMPGQAAPAGLPGAGPGEARPGPVNILSEAPGKAPAGVLSLSDEELGADDLLSVLRREAMREKKRDDTSLVRDLQGVKVTGRELLEELSSLVKDMRGR